ncbi:uncharacterized protein LOC141618132 [Silene latifolia]|uniref:uncharacterized protein LOC141618132 n=1 Tax=Silene latifolia TaxID=37657 RepID=UPI003D78A27A
MASLEALYGRWCRSLVCWDDSLEAVVLGLQMIQDMIDQVHVIRQRMKAAQDQQKSYADLHRRDIEFKVGDKTYVETPKEILDRKVRKTRYGDTVLVKVLWSNHKVEEETWEAKEAMKERYPHLFDRLEYKLERPQNVGAQIRRIMQAKCLPLVQLPVRDQDRVWLQQFEGC